MTVELTDSESYFSDEEFSVNEGNSGIWMMEGDQWDWISFDVYAGSWGLMASGGDGTAYLWSRTLTQPQFVIDAAAGVLALEGFTINSWNNRALTNLNCSWTQKSED